MSALEEKRIVIKLPNLNLRSLMNFRFFIFVALVFLFSAFGYWYQSVRPWLWISSAHLESPSTIISSDVAGRIVEMSAQEGDYVKKGQTLFVLDRDVILAKQTQAKLFIDSINEQIQSEKERIGKAMEEYITATTELELGIGSADLVKKQLLLMEEAQEKSEAAFSRLASARAELNFLDLQVKKMTLSAPFDGIVLKSAKNLGAVVSFGEPIYALCDPHHVWVEANVPENEISRIAIGTPVSIKLPSYPGREFTGKVSWIGPATVAKSSQLPFSGNNEAVPVKVSIEKSDVSFKPGLSAHIGFKVR